METNQSKCCVVCGETEREGISIWNSFICQPCEQEMVQTDALDAKYPFFIEKMKSIWRLEA
ncbi:sigma factor G inhibitor Gin [Ammoniphilus sp. YIM 78166]|uniref:sigma factor G inhibitor Gin n=1 Tax=Ammoniphilus sp. YIM 78166 TaxID=1644106 RepID=UPI001070224D|nr:sigma factor G inhibitor Gin [Ammoniphilus sp. YIM 78166]